MRRRLAFLGSPEFAVPSLRAVAARHDVLLVATQPDRPSGRGRRLEPTPVRRAAESLGLPLCTWERGGRAAIEARLAALGLDALVVVAFGVILRRSTLDCARRGAVNVHASLLPRWRGAAPIERAILAGDATTGVTLMVIDAGIDTGPTLARRELAIAPDDTRVSLGERLAAAGAELLVERLESYLDGELGPVAQPATGVTYAPRIETREGRIDWSRPASAIDAQVRGLYERPGAVTRLGGQDLKVHQAGVRPASRPAPPGTLVEADPRQGVAVACGEGALELVVVQLAGRSRALGVDLVRGRLFAPGMRLGE